MKETVKNENETHSNDRIEPDACLKAPEWAEHARFLDDDQPCDDGRAGKI
jgi:hypothetical protein